MKDIIDFVKNPNITETKVFKKSKCSTADEGEILRFLTQEYIKNKHDVDILKIFKVIFSATEVEEILSRIEIIKNLYGMDYIELTGNNNYFVKVVNEDEDENYDISEELEKKKPKKYVEFHGGRDGFGFLEMTQLEVSLSSDFLLFLDQFTYDNKDKVQKGTKRKVEIEPYLNNYEFLQDQFERINMYIKIYESSVKYKNTEALASLKNKLSHLEEVIEDRISKSEIRFYLREFLQKNSLARKEEIIFLTLLAEEFDSIHSEKNYRSFDKLLALITFEEPQHRLQNRTFFEDNAKLISENIIEVDNTFVFVSSDGKVSKTEFFVPDEVLEIIEFGYPDDELESLKTEKKSKRKKSEKSKLQKAIESQDLFELRDPKTDLNDVVLPKSTREILNTIVQQLDKRVTERLVKWEIKEDKKGVEAKIIFYGSAGTGKTMTAISLAKTLDRQLLHLDCSKILSMYVGESEKNVRNIFDTYYDIVEKSNTEPILFLDEADQFLTARFSSPDHSVSQMYNQMQNIFLEQIENFNGILIASTNLLENIDKAFSRRFNYKVEFKMPNEKERAEIWEKTLPKKAPFEDNFNVKKLSEYKLSGGQIQLIIKNTAYKIATMEKPLFTVEKFVTEIERETKSNFDSSKKMGFLK